MLVYSCHDILSSFEEVPCWFVLSATRLVGGGGFDGGVVLVRICMLSTSCPENPMGYPWRYICRAGGFTWELHFCPFMGLNPGLLWRPQPVD
jgi:hypothetical protein